jgi:hypothetical protein
VDRILDQRQWAAAESFADFLAVTWRLSHAATGDLRELIRRLATQHGPAAQKTQALLGHLETVLLEGRATYYRISVRTWLAKGKSGGRLRQVLPFQGTLKSLAALEAATVLLLPGIFGFLFWELKENWGLYGNNRAEPVPQARLGSHGETLNGMLRRGFHSGTIPKAFDRLREVLDDQIRREAPGPRQLRRALAPLAQIDAMISRFGEQELAGPLRDACPEGLVTKTESRIASRGVELRAGLHSADGVESVELSLKLTMRGTALVCTPSLTGPVRQLSAF